MKLHKMAIKVQIPQNCTSVQNLNAGLPVTSTTPGNNVV